MHVFPVNLPSELNGWRPSYSLSSTQRSEVWIINKNNAPGIRCVMKLLYPIEGPESIADKLHYIKQASGCCHTIPVSVCTSDPETGIGIVVMPVYETLQEYHMHNSVSQEKILDLGIQISEGLDALHRMGLMHTDIKPENIFLNDCGEFLIGDLDAVIPIGAAARELTFEYAAPELLQNAPAEENSDLYSLSLTLYRFVNKGRMPFLSLQKQILSLDDREKAQEMRLKGTPIPSSCSGGRELDSVLKKAADFHPEKRYPNAESFLTALRRIPIQQKKRKRIRILSRAAIIIALCFLVGFGIHQFLTVPVIHDS